MHKKQASRLTESNPQGSKYGLSVSFLAIFMLIGQKWQKEDLV